MVKFQLIIWLFMCRYAQWACIQAYLNEIKRKNHSQSTLLSAHIKTGFYVILPCMAGAFSISFNSLHYMIFFFFCCLSQTLFLTFSSLFFLLSFRFSRHLLNIIIAHFSRSSLLYKKIKMKKEMKEKNLLQSERVSERELEYFIICFFVLSFIVSELAVLCIPSTRLCGWELLYRL